MGGPPIWESKESAAGSFREDVEFYLRGFFFCRLTAVHIQLAWRGRFHAPHHPKLVVRVRSFLAKGLLVSLMMIGIYLASRASCIENLAKIPS